VRNGCEPDYWGLVTLLLSLKNYRYLCAACPELTISKEEAQKIQALGFRAQAGRWKIPYIPFWIVRDGPLEWAAWIEPQTVTGDGQGQACEAAVPPPTELQPLQVTGGNPERATPSGEDREAAARETPTLAVDACRQQPQINAPMLPPRQSLEADRKLVEECASKIEAAAQRAGGEIDRRRLQQKLWRYPAPIFNQALRYLATHYRVTIGHQFRPG
jgi:hypothetical protein